MMKITAFPRIHVTLIGMNSNGHRINGGIGFAFSNPDITVCIEHSAKLEIIDSREFPINSDQLMRLENSLRSVIKDKKLNTNVKFSISGNLPTNCGFGSGTIIRLACIELTLLFFDVPYTEDEIVTFSKRGGTSGVGINTYFNGGFSLDIGKKSANEIVPSSIAERCVSPLLILDSGNMPDWEIGICFPRKQMVKKLSEEDFFKKTIPINNASVYECLYHVVYGVYASFKELDRGTFSKAVNAIQLTEWKKAEWEINNVEIKNVAEQIRRCNAECVGLSSLGPMLFFISSNLEETIHNLRQKLGDGFYFYKANTINHGRRIEYV